MPFWSNSVTVCAKAGAASSRAAARVDLRFIGSSSEPANPGPAKERLQDVCYRIVTPESFFGPERLNRHPPGGDRDLAPAPGFAQRPAVSTLFPPQSDKGIHSGGALGRQQTGEERDSHEYRGYHQERREIGGLHFEQKFCEDASDSQSACYSECHAHGRQKQTAPQDHAGDVALLSSQRHPNSDIA